MRAREQRGSIKIANPLIEGNHPLLEGTHPLLEGTHPLLEGGYPLLEGSRFLPNPSARGFAISLLRVLLFYPWALPEGSDFPATRPVSNGRFQIESGD